MAGKYKNYKNIILYNIIFQHLSVKEMEDKENESNEEFNAVMAEDSYQYYFQAFKGMKQLRKVTLDHNKITEIQPFAFKVYTF